MKVKEKKILLSDFFEVLRKYFLLILACALVFGAAGFLLASRKVSEYYTASADIYILTVTADMDLGVTSTDVALARSLAADCKRTMLNDKLVDNVRLHFAARRSDSPSENWEDLAGYSDAALLAMVTVENEANTQLVSIKVTAPTASLAVHLANAIAAETEVSTVDIIGNFKALPSRSAHTATRFRTDARISRALSFAVIGVVLSYAVLLVMNLSNRRIRCAEEAADFADYLPSLGLGSALVTHGKKQPATPMLLRNSDSETQREAYNRIRTAIAAMTAEVACPVIGVTSATDKEGSAACCENLALSFARLGRRVLVVDADLRAAAAPAIFGDGEGFFNLLEGGAVTPSASGEDNLFVLPRGMTEQNPADLLGHASFAAKMQSLCADFDMVFVSLPPVLGVADALVAAPRFTGAVVTLAENITDRRNLAVSLDALYNVGTNLLGSVAV